VGWGLEWLLSARCCLTRPNSASVSFLDHRTFLVTLVIHPPTLPLPPPSNYVFEHLSIEDIESQQTNLQLGFPANVVHVVRPNSPLYNLRWGDGRDWRLSSAGCVPRMSPVSKTQ
jgi:hypothetical protein